MKSEVDPLLDRLHTLTLLWPPFATTAACCSASYHTQSCHQSSHLRSWSRYWTVCSQALMTCVTVTSCTRWRRWAMPSCESPPHLCGRVASTFVWPGADRGCGACSGALMIVHRCVSSGPDACNLRRHRNACRPLPLLHMPNQLLTSPFPPCCIAEVVWEAPRTPAIRAMPRCESPCPLCMY